MQRLVLFFDGTWNTETVEGEVTNVFELKRLVEAANLSPNPTNSIEQRTFYDRGVGTDGPIDRVRGGMLGFGLTRNVKEGYRFLSQFFESKGGESDEIYIFGFSRGAFTARSLAGFIAAAGLLKKQNCDEETLQRAWRYYRTPVKKRMPADKARLEALCNDGVRITLLGVFDTVGALGIPTGTAGNWAGYFDRFHDTKLGSAVDVALHAIALDEHRTPFEPALFVRPDHHGNKLVEQAWFPGVHSDIGGGYPARGTEDRVPIAKISLDWMVKRIRASRVGLALADPGLPTANRPYALHPIHVPDEPHDSIGWFLLDRFRPTYRLVQGAGLVKPPSGPYHTYGVPFPDVSWKEKVHRSVFDLILEDAGYRPPQIHDLIAAVDAQKISVVDTDGSDLKDAEAQALVAAVKLELGGRTVPAPQTFGP